MNRILLLAALVLSASAISISCTREKVAHADCKPLSEDCRPEMNTNLLDGNALSEPDLKGKVVMVNFWATWCGPCAAELPSLDAVYRRYKDKGYISLGVVVADRATDDAVRNFATAHGVSYPLLRATGDMGQRFAVGEIVPTTFVYDKKGRLRAHWDGAIREKILEAEVSKLLAETD